MDLENHTVEPTSSVFDPERFPPQPMFIVNITEVMSFRCHGHFCCSDWLTHALNRKMRWKIKPPGVMGSSDPLDVAQNAHGPHPEKTVCYITDKHCYP